MDRIDYIALGIEYALATDDVLAKPEINIERKNQLLGLLHREYLRRAV